MYRPRRIIPFALSALVFFGFFNLSYVYSNPIADAYSTRPAISPISEAKTSLPPAAATPRVETDYGRLPLYFIENRGQVDKRVKYYVRGGGQTTFFTQDGVVLSLAKPGTKRAARQSALIGGGQPSRRDLHRQPVSGNHSSVVRIKPVGLKKGVTIAALNQTDHRVNYFIGKDPDKFYTDIPTYQAVVYEQAYTGIDLKFYGQGRQLEYDIVVQPGADPNQVKLAYQGVKKLEVTQEGDLALILPDGGRLLQKKPLVYQEIAGQRVPVEGKFRLCRQGAHVTCGFALAAYDKTRALVIDPVLIYSTYLGGSGSDLLYSLAVDADGAAYLAGQTLSSNFPNENAYQSSLKGTSDAFVTKLSPAGNSLLFSTYLGGDSNESAYGIAVDANRNAYVTGSTASTNFPTQNAFQSTLYGSSDAFVTKLSPAGNSLLFSTYLGGNDQDTATGIAVDGSDAAHVTGWTYSDFFPTTVGAYNNTRTGEADAFVTKFHTEGDTLAYSTYLGGTKYDQATGIAVDDSGAAYVAGYTYSVDFPRWNAFQMAIGGSVDVFVTKLSPNGDTLTYSTYLGGTKYDQANGIAVDDSGAAYVVGLTQSTDFPIEKPFQNTLRGIADAFITKFSPNGNALAYSTYLGGNNYDAGYAIAIDGFGAAYVTGYTWSSDYPTSKAFQNALAGIADGFVTKLNPAGNGLVYSTYLGGNKDDAGTAIAVDSYRAAYVAGDTDSTIFPTRNAFQENFAGVRDGFVSKLSRGQSLVPYLLLLD